MSLRVEITMRRDEGKKNIDAWILKHAQGFVSAGSPLYGCPTRRPARERDGARSR